MLEELAGFLQMEPYPEIGWFCSKQLRNILFNLLRTKEIGIRKVLGASIFMIWKMLSRDFAWLVVVSILVAFPLAYYYSNQWLMQYDYRVEISWWVFAVTAVGTLLITLFSVSFQSIKAALANPVDSLRSEQITRAGSPPPDFLTPPGSIRLL